MDFDDEQFVIVDVVWTDEERAIVDAELEALRLAMIAEDAAYDALLASNPTGLFVIGLDGRREYC